MQPIRLDKAVKNGLMFPLELRDGETATPPKNHCWLIMHGVGYHEVATGTALHVRDKHSGLFWNRLMGYAAADASTFTPIPQGGGTTFNVVTDEFELVFAGAANAYARLMILEWQVS